MADAYQSYAPYLWAALVALVIVLALWIITLQLRVNRLIGHYTRLFSGTTFGTFEEAMDRYVGRLEETVDRVAALNQLCLNVQNELNGTIQKVGIVRFNPFNDVGSDQSFALALLNAKGTGIVLSSLFSRTSTRMFAKAIVEAKSPYPLTDEEREAIEQAMASKSGALAPGTGHT
jgi:hypothetical protein